MKILALPLVLAVSLSIASADLEDTGPTATGATSANGMWKVDLKTGRVAGFSLMKKDDKGEYREIAKGDIEGLDGCHHWTSYVSDEGRFAVVNVATSEKDKVIALYSNNGQRKATLEIPGVLNKDEMASLPGRSRCPGHQNWSNGITINGESLVVETLAGRKVTVSLKDACEEFQGTEELSANGNHRVSLDRNLKFTVEEKGADASWKKKKEGQISMSHPHPSIKIADDGHFVVFNSSGGEWGEYRFFIYNPGGALVKKLRLSQLLGPAEVKVSFTQGHLHWFKSVKWVSQLSDTGLSLATAKRVQDLIAKLGDDDNKVRDTAQAELVGIGKPAVPYLEKAAESDDIEAKTRAARALENISSADRWVFETNWGQMKIIYADGKVEEVNDEEWRRPGECKGDCPERVVAADEMGSCRRCGRLIQCAMCDVCSDEIGACRKCSRKLVK